MLGLSRGVNTPCSRVCKPSALGATVTYFSNMVCRKRVNDSLNQLRTLLPQSAFMKKDMASILEQTVEYINIMHNILNEEEPACLSKVPIDYLNYLKKYEYLCILKCKHIFTSQGILSATI